MEQHYERLEPKGATDRQAITAESETVQPQVAPEITEILQGVQRPAIPWKLLTPEHKPRPV
jgi:hypothetical protein